MLYELCWDIVVHFILTKLDTVIAESGRLYIGVSE